MADVQGQVEVAATDEIDFRNSTLETARGSKFFYSSFSTPRTDYLEVT